MASFVLIHGTSCGGWIWKKISPLLRQRGHEVYAPTLTGLSDRSHLSTCSVNLTTHITDVTSLITYEDLSDVILVGNSYGGMVITGVAAEIPGRIRLLVYLDAYLPDNGQSEADLLPPEMLASRKAEAARHAGLVPPPPLDIFGLDEPGLESWAMARMTPQPFATYTEPVSAQSSGAPAVPGVYVHCVGNPPGTPDLFASSAAKAMARGWQVISLDAGHLAMLTAPDQVARILLDLVA